jgi:hypothetical protein
MTHAEYCAHLNRHYWLFERAGFHATAAAIAGMLMAELQ